MSLKMINLARPNKLMAISNANLIFLPTPRNISIFWNFGFLLAATLRIQLITGIFLAIHYSRNTELSFAAISIIMQEVNIGWATRIFHTNGASMFFFFLYMHISRGIYFGSYFLAKPWFVGVTILLFSIATAFLGYVLPWGQISFWGATVITNLFSAIPILGDKIVLWLWGGFSVDSPTLTRFFRFHFILPFLILRLTVIHLFFLHDSGSLNPLGAIKLNDKIPFHSYFILKDILILLILLLGFSNICFYSPWFFGDPENFIPANPLVTPPHIQPEWYFLFSYAILRSVPNKLGGVVALLFSIIILIFMPFYPKHNFMTLCFSPVRKFYFWVWTVTAILLVWIGARPVEHPYIFLGQLLTVNYFSFFFALPLCKGKESQELYKL